MDQAGVLITAAGAVIAAALALVGSVLSWRAKRQVNNAKQQVQRIEVQIKQVHELVNSRMSDMEDRVRQLIAALDESGTPVPPTPKRKEAEGADS